MALKILAFGLEENILKVKAHYPDLINLGEHGVNSFNTTNGSLGSISDEQVVLIVNSDQVLLTGGLNHFLAKYQKQNCDILFSASASYHYDDDVLRYYFWKFYPRFTKTYHYLDSNAFIGKAGAIRSMINQIGDQYPTDFSWHDLLTRFYVDYLLQAIQPDLIVKLDHEQTLFGNLEGRRSAFKWPMQSWIQADLFLRHESATLSQINKNHLQDKLWDVDNGKGGIPITKRKKTSPAIWISLGDRERIKKRLENRRTNGKGFNIFLLSLSAYLSSFVSFLFAFIINRGETRPFRIFRYSSNKNPEWSQTMEKFLGHLDRGEGFTFAHFNDGELTFIKKFINEDHAETWFGRRQQKYTKILGGQLTKALKLDQERYYVGVPCSTHHPRLRKLANELVEGQTNIVPAMSLHHNPRFFPNIINHMKDRETFFVKNEYQKLDVFEKLGVEIKEENQIIVPFKNSYLLFDELKERRFPDGAIVILICGMLAKIIIPEWFERNSNTTFIALGSSMDDFIQRTNTKFRLYPQNGLPLTCNIQPTKFFAFGWKRKCKECWNMDEEFDLPYQHKKRCFKLN